MYKISYIDLIRLVHPDVNGPYSSTERAKLVNLNRHNEKKLNSLAMEWGILTRPAEWRVPALRLRRGDIITYIVATGRGVKRMEGVISKVYESEGQLYGIVVGSDGIKRTFGKSSLRTFKVRFERKCEDPEAYVTRATMRLLSLSPNRDYSSKNRWVWFLGKRYRVHHTDSTKVYIYNKYGIIAMNPKSLWRANDPGKSTL